MPSLRLYPLLLAGAACLTLAACGGDDDPAPQAAAPAQTESATATQTAPTQTATTVPEAGAPTDSKGSGGAGDAPDATPQNGSDRTSDGKGSSTSPSGSEPDKVRDAVVGLQEAFAAKDGQKACSLMIGIPQKSDPKNPGLSCESLSRGAKGTLSEENRRIAANAKVTIDGNKATAELKPGVPLTLRKIDGRWRVDYSQMGRSRGSR